jgi:Ca2+-binding EF-hand superfamily protein
VLTKQDFEVFTERYKTFSKANTTLVNHVRRKMLMFWERYVEPLSKEGPITPERYAKAIALQSTEKLISNAAVWADILFDLLDVNADGHLSLDEFKILHKLFHLNDSTAEAAFKAMDKNKNGVVEYFEFVSAVVLFFTPGEEKERPESIFFGPLVN